MTASDDLDRAFEAAERRMVALRMTPQELVKKYTRMSYVTYWRSVNGLNQQSPKDATRTKVLRRIEGALDRAEKERTKNAT